MKKIILLIFLIIYSVKSFAYDLTGHISSGISIHDAGKVVTNNITEEILLESVSVVPTYQTVDGRPSFERDTSVVIKIKDKILEKLDYTIQLESDGQKNFEPKIEKINVSHNLGNNLFLRVGRMRVPFFKFSDTFLENFSNPWFLPPEEMYGQFFADWKNINGVQLEFSMKFLDQDILILGQTGSERTKIDILGRQADVSVRNHYGVFAGLKNEVFDLHCSFHTGSLNIKKLDKITNAIKSFFDYSNLLGVPSASNQYVNFWNVDNKRARYFNAGGKFEWENLYILGEYSRRFVNGWISDSQAFYITAGYRFGNILPTFSFSEAAGTDNHLMDFVPLASKFEGEIDTLLGAAFVTAAELKVKNDLASLKAKSVVISEAQQQLKKFVNYYQRSLSANLRYEFWENVVFKANFKRVFLNDDSNGLFDVKPIRKHANMYTIGVQARY